MLEKILLKFWYPRVKLYTIPIFHWSTDLYKALMKYHLIYKLNEVYPYVEFDQLEWNTILIKCHFDTMWE